MTTPTPTAGPLSLSIAQGAPRQHIEEALAALANHNGGPLLIQHDSVNTADDIIDRALEAALALEPALILPLPRVVNEHVVVTVPAGMPHVYATSSGRYVTHEGSHIVPLPARDLRRLMMLRGEMAFESNPAPGANRDDLDWSKIAEYAARLPGYTQANAEELMLQRGCLMTSGSTLRPTNAGILLFGRDPQRFVRSAMISAVRFDGEAMSDHHERLDLTGTLIDQIKRMEGFLHANLRRDVLLGETMARQEQYEYPMEAARELIINALAHRDYSIDGDNIRVLIFSNRFEVHSPGGLPGYMTLQNLKDERFSRNPVIVQVLSDLLYIERLGYGVDRVMELMQAQSLRAPEFVERSGGFKATLFNARENLPKPQQAVALQGIYHGKEINPRQERALTMLMDSATGRLTNSDLQSLFPDIHSETIRRDLVDLVNKQILVKMGQKRGSYYVLKRSAETGINDR